MLEDVDVAVVGEGVWGQLTGTYLAEYGARVLRLEGPSGDPLRRARWGPGPGDTAWSVVARGGRSLTCDVTTSAGREAAARLFGRVDVVVDGAGGRWVDGLTLDAVVVRVSALDDLDLPAGPGDGLLAAAAGGLLHLTGRPSEPPVRLGGDVVEHLTAALACQAALGGLLARRRRLPGPWDARVSGEAAARRILEWTIVAHEVTGRVRQREGNHPSAAAPLGLYPTADGALVAIVGAADANFARLVATMEQPELLDDPRFATATARAEHGTDANAAVAAWTARLPLAEVVRRCLDGGVLVGAVRSVTDVLADPQIAARGDIVDWAVPGGGAPVPQPAPQPHSPLLAAARPLAPALGEADGELGDLLA